MFFIIQAVLVIVSLLALAFQAGAAIIAFKNSLRTGVPFGRARRNAFRSIDLKYWTLFALLFSGTYAMFAIAFLTEGLDAPEGMERKIEVFTICSGLVGFVALWANPCFLPYRDKDRRLPNRSAKRRRVYPQ